MINSGERCLIINADDFGMCHSTNRAISTLLTEGAVTSSSLMMTCPWVNEAAAFIRKHPQMDVGIHFTHTSEWELYRWGPLRTDLHTLVDEQGYFPRDTGSVVRNADAEQLREEAVAQMELCLKMGIDPTNIDNHMGSLHHVMDIMLELCAKYRLPLRYPKRLPFFVNDSSEHGRVVSLAEKMGVLLPDSIVALDFSREGAAPAYEAVKQQAMQHIRELKTGVTELIFHPSLDTEELKAITDSWPIRRFEFDVFRDEEVQALLKKEEIRLVHWRDLRDLQRA